jgi:putative membrane-bound dehydrogenase-like protein
MQTFASEPLVSDPVAFDIDAQGRFFVAESERQERGIEDNRTSSWWLLDDLTAQTVADRLAYYEKWKDKREGGMDYYRKYADRIRRIEDTDGNGSADRVTNYSRDFRDPLDGTGAGVLVDGDRVLYTCIPSLWQFRDKNDDGVADTTDALSTGYGIRTALRGHDMHGLVIGPDGRIYWSIGDRGYRVATREGGTLFDPKTGAVFRCRPDGSELEIYASSFRNPQELAFNEYGDLFTGDNNSDGGDSARFVFVMPFGQTGWDMNYQTLEGANHRGPWSQERIWHVRDQPDREYPAWSLPPLAFVGNGPSGLAYAPGTGLPAAWDHRFFLCDFLGSESHSGIIAVKVQMKGAGYEVTESKQFALGLLATDVAFGFDGRIYASLWGGGWLSTGKGRIVSIFDPATSGTPLVAQTRTILTQDIKGVSTDQLIALLQNRDQRVRQRAQFELAARGGSSTLQLLALAQAGPPAVENQRLAQLAQIHAIWALGMQAQGIRCDRVQKPDPLLPVISLLDHEDAEIRAQAARTLGESGRVDAAKKLVEHLVDENTRVRAACALACARLAPKASALFAEAVPLLSAALFENDNADPFLRHALATALAACADPKALQTLSVDQFESVRLGALLAMRRNADPMIANFLFDPDMRLAAEAARAIWDVPIERAAESLATAAGRLAEWRPPTGTKPVTPVTFQRSWWRDVPIASSTELESCSAWKRQPDKTDTIGEAVGFTDRTSNSVQRLHGTVTAPASGVYRFFVTSDDHSVLLMTRGDAQAGGSAAAAAPRVIARLDGYANEGDWDGTPSQMSAPIELNAGDTVTLTALQAQGGGASHVAIGWQLPDGTMERPIGRMPVDTNLLAFARRAIAANLILGGDRAGAIASIALNRELPAVVRIEALAALSDFAAPQRRDRVHGRVDMLSLGSRTTESLQRALTLALPALAADQDSTVRTSAVQLASDANIALDQTANLAAVKDATRSVRERIACLAQLGRAQDTALSEAINAALADKEPKLRSEARAWLARTDPQRALDESARALSNGSEAEQQSAILALGQLTSCANGSVAASARTQLDQLLMREAKTDLPSALRLELSEAATALSEGHEGKRWPIGSTDPGVTDALLPLIGEGGDPEIGREVLMYHSAAACLRCHAVAGVGGHAGPALDGVATRLDRRAIVQSMLEPNALIAPGFSHPSAMPAMGPLLKPRELRDLTAYLSTLR